MNPRIPLVLPALFAACAAPEPRVEDPLAGTWQMVSDMRGSEIEAVMTLVRDDAGGLTGEWLSRGSSMQLSDILVEGDALEFDRAIPGGDVLHFSGTAVDGTIAGSWSGPFGEISVTGSRAEGPIDAPVARDSYHDRPIRREDGKTMLWANDDEWFDLTDSKIDPEKFQHGIGKDSIQSIDEPQFVPADDERLAEAEIDRDTQVLGVEIDGEARAYPVSLMSSHEIVNDRFGGTAYAVLW